MNWAGYQNTDDPKILATLLACNIRDVISLEILRVVACNLGLPPIIVPVEERVKENVAANIAVNNKRTFTAWIPSQPFQLVGIQLTPK